MEGEIDAGSEGRSLMRAQAAVRSPTTWSTPAPSPALGMRSRRPHPATLAAPLACLSPSPCRLHAEAQPGSPSVPSSGLEPAARVWPARRGGSPSPPPRRRRRSPRARVPPTQATRIFPLFPSVRARGPRGPGVKGALPNHFCLSSSVFGTHRTPLLALACPVPWGGIFRERRALRWKERRCLAEGRRPPARAHTPTSSWHVGRRPASRSQAPSSRDPSVVRGLSRLLSTAAADTRAVSGSDRLVHTAARSVAAYQRLASRVSLVRALLFPQAYGMASEGSEEEEAPAARVH